MERLEQQLQFLLEIDKEKQIKRQTLQSNGKDFEDDAQHAWHMAVMALVLKEYANETIDISHVIAMLLIHDLVEIDAGDTYAYDEKNVPNTIENQKQQKESSIYCLKIRQRRYWICGMNLRKEKRQKLNLPVHWTIFNLSC